MCIRDRSYTAGLLWWHEKKMLQKYLKHPWYLLWSLWSYPRDDCTRHWDVYKRQCLYRFSFIYAVNDLWEDAYICPINIMNRKMCIRDRFPDPRQAFLRKSADTKITHLIRCRDQNHAVLFFDAQIHVFDQYTGTQPENDRRLYSIFRQSPLE